MKTRLGERVAFAMERRGINQSELARKVGMEPQGISYLVKYGRSTGKLTEISRALQVGLEWLSDDESPLDDNAFIQNAVEIERHAPGDASMIIDALVSGRLPTLQGQDLMPVFTGARAGEHGEIFVDDGPVDYIPKPPNLSGIREAYGMIVIGNSMEPMYKPHQTIHVNPTRRPVPGRGVVVWLTNNGVLVKEYVRRTATHLVLKEYNPAPRELAVPVENVSKFHLIVGVEESP